MLHVKAGDMQDEKKLKFIRLALLFHDSGKPRTKTTDDKGIDHFHGHAAVSEEIAGTALRRLRFYKIFACYGKIFDRETIPFA